MTTMFRLSPAFCVENGVAILNEENSDSKFIITIGFKENCLENTKEKIEHTFYRRINKEI